MNGMCIQKLKNQTAYFSCPQFNLAKETKRRRG